jgi:iron(III) transport system permease protein
MVVVAFLLATLTGRLVGDAAQYTVVSGRGAQSTTHTPRRWQLLGVGTIVTILVFGVILPFFQLFILGVLQGRRWAIENLTLNHFINLYSSDLATAAVQNSVIIAFVTASVAVIVTAYIAYVKSRENNLRSRLISWLAWIPIATPGVVLGIAYLWTYLWVPIGLYGTIFALMLAYLVRFLALGTRMNESLIVQQSPTLDEQGKICGAGLVSRLRHIIFPNMKSGMISIWVILFALFMNELSTSIFLYTSSSRVFTVTLYEFWSTAQTSALAALAITQVAITISVISVGMWYFDIDIRVA